MMSDHDEETKDELVQTKRELWQVRAEADELRLKLSNLERIDRGKSSELLEELTKGKRAADELQREVKRVKTENTLLVQANFGLCRQHAEAKAELCRQHAEAKAEMAAEMAQQAKTFESRLRHNRFCRFVDLSSVMSDLSLGSSPSP